MVAYERFAAFYDEVMDDPAPRAARVTDAITRYRPEATSLLELGCGTGAILRRLTGLPTLVGLDRSPAMLAVAAANVPDAGLVLGDMACFSFGRTFDAVVCVFDTLNHLLTFEDWRSTFDSVGDHLAPGGLFVFDVNTVGELRRLGEDPPAVYDFGRGVAIVDVAFAHDGEDGGLSQWDIRIFEDGGGDIDGCDYRLHRELIGELGVSLDRICTEVESRFDLLELTDGDRFVATDDSVKAHFVCRQRRRRSWDGRGRAGGQPSGTPVEETTPGTPAGAESSSTSTGAEAETTEVAKPPT